MARKNTTPRRYLVWFGSYFIVEVEALTAREAMDIAQRDLRHASHGSWRSLYARATKARLA